MGMHFTVLLSYADKDIRAFSLPAYPSFLPSLVVRYPLLGMKWCCVGCSCDQCPVSASSPGEHPHMAH